MLSQETINRAVRTKNWQALAAMLGMSEQQVKARYSNDIMLRTASASLNPHLAVPTTEAAKRAWKDNLNYRMEQGGITIKLLAQHVGINSATLSKALAIKGRFSANVMRSINVVLPELEALSLPTNCAVGREELRAWIADIRNRMKKSHMTFKDMALMTGFSEHVCSSYLLVSDTTSRYKIDKITQAVKVFEESLL